MAASGMVRYGSPCMHNGTFYIRVDEDGKYWDLEGVRVLRPAGTPWVTGLQAWCRAIPEELRDTLVVIGAYTGEGSLIQSDYFRRVIDIDPWQDADVLYKYYLRCVSSQPNIEHIRGYSTQVIPTLPERKYIFYIDGSHRRRAVEADIVVCKGRLASGDYFGGHDYVAGSDVQIAVDRYFPTVEVFEDSSWLTRID